MLPPGQYRVNSPLLREPQTVHLNGEVVTPRPVEMRDFHVVEVRPRSRGREMTSITFTADAVRGGPTASPTDGFFGVEWLLLSRETSHALYALPAGEEAIHAYVSGPRLKPLAHRFSPVAGGRTVLEPESLP